MNNTTDMTTGSPVKLILAFGMPLLFGNILQQLYNFVDTVVVGRSLGMNALAAVGTTGSINFLVLGFVMGMAQGVSILVSQYFGAKDHKKLRRSISMSAYLNITVGIVTTFLATFASRAMLQWMNTPIEILDMAVEYIHIIFLGTLVSLAYNFFSGILRALGDARNPLIAMIIAFFVNTILDIWFVAGLRIGVSGAAYATVIAQGISAIYCLVCLKNIEFLRFEKEDWKPDSGLLKRSLTLSLPVAIMNSITAVGVMVLQAAINGFGALYVAGYTAASKVIIILEQISSTFGFASSTYVGQNMGALQIDRIKKGVRQINLTVIGMNAFCALMMIVFGKGLIRFMVSANEEEVTQVAYHCLVFLSCFLVALGILWVHRCSLQSMGDTFYPMLSGILEFVSRIFFVWLLPRFFEFNGVLASEVSAWISAAIFLVVVFKYRLKHIKVQEQKMENA
ncbi:MATE efflux family protein [Firmicutes bacterium M10-2]|nr:MATE efflux family protein [Firmicutes bacterium M10-2]